MNTEVVVVGGGVVGASAAYHLARAGARVTLVDRADVGQATAAGAGIIAPGTSLRPLPAFYPFGYAAARAYPGLVANLAEDGEPETGFAVVGLLFVATDAAEAARLPETAALFRSRAGEDPTIGTVSEVSGAEARALFPPLAEVPAALRVSGAARVDGRLLRDALRGAAARRGATILHGDATPEVSGGRATGVLIGDRRIAADALVAAGGAWSNALGDALGVRLPTEPQRGQILHLRSPGTRTARWPIVIGF
ncbi:MAG: D-amino acid dehydrogenase, partial [uncultured Thermomicrobiales bacterium]